MDLVRVETKSQVCMLLSFRSKGMVHVRFQVLMAVHINITASFDVMPCSLVERYQSFGGIYCLHLQAVF